jgi:hypothetical protein
MVLRSMVSRNMRTATSRKECFDILFSPPWKISQPYSNVIIVLRPGTSAIYPQNRLGATSSGGWIGRNRGHRQRVRAMVNGLALEPLQISTMT